MAGVAAADASGTTSADIPVYMFSAEQVWRAFVNTAVTPTASLTVGVDYKVKQASVGAAEVSTAAGTDVVVYSLKAEGKDGTSAGDPILVKIDYNMAYEIGWDTTTNKDYFKNLLYDTFDTSAREALVEWPNMFKAVKSKDYYERRARHVGLPLSEELADGGAIILLSIPLRT
jgi:hypothetical protein